MRSASLGFGLVLALGLVALVIAGATRDASAGLDLGVPADDPLVGALAPGQVACQGPVLLDEDLSVLEFTPAPGGKRGPKMTVALLDFDSRRPLATTRIAPEIMTGQPRRTRIGPAGGGRAVDVCFRNDGGPRVQLWGDRASGNGRQVVGAGSHPTLSTATARLNGKALDGDLFVRFPAKPRSVLAEVPTMFERMSRFRFPGYGAWGPWALLGLLVVGGALGGRALARAAAAED